MKSSEINSPNDFGRYVNSLAEKKIITGLPLSFASARKETYFTTSISGAAAVNVQRYLEIYFSNLCSAVVKSDMKLYLHVNDLNSARALAFALWKGRETFLAAANVPLPSAREPAAKKAEPDSEPANKHADLGIGQFISYSKFEMPEVSALANADDVSLNKAKTSEYFLSRVQVARALDEIGRADSWGRDNIKIRVQQEAGERIEFLRASSKDYMFDPKVGIVSFPSGTVYKLLEAGCFDDVGPATYFDLHHCAFRTINQAELTKLRAERPVRPVPKELQKYFVPEAVL